MKNLFLTLEGVQVLSKTQQKNVVGGLAYGGGEVGGSGTFGGECSTTLDGVKQTGTCSASGKYCICSNPLGSSC